MPDKESNTTLIKEISGFKEFNSTTNPNANFKALFLDTETTSLDFETNEITEIYAGLVTFCDKGVIHEITKDYQSYQEIQGEMNENSQKITNITKESLKGKKIDWGHVNELAKEANVLISFNAEFDRNVLEKYSEVFKNKIWLCAMKDFDWIDNFGFGGSQELLFFKIKEKYYNAHNAKTDTHALMDLLNAKIPSKDETIFSNVLKILKEKEYTVTTKGSNYKHRETLKKNSFFWKDAWVKITTTPQQDLELLETLKIPCVIEELPKTKRYTRNI